MNCHVRVKTQSPLLTRIRESYATGEPVPWVKVHKLPDYVYFNHSAHLSAGVSCVSCHGRVDQMIEVKQVQPLSMGLVPGVPSQPGAEPAAGRARHQARLEAGSRPGRDRTRNHTGQAHRSAGQLLGVPSMTHTGKTYWRSLEQLADTPRFREWLHREFPENASEMLSSRFAPHAAEADGSLDRG